MFYKNVGVDNDQLAVYSSLHKTNASPSLMLEKKRELGLEIEDHYDPEDLNNSRLIITTHKRWMKEWTDDFLRFYIA